MTDMAKYYVFEVPNDNTFDELGSALFTNDERADCVEFALTWFLDNKGQRSIMVIDPEFNLITDYWISSHWKISDTNVMTQVGGFD